MLPATCAYDLQLNRQVQAWFGAEQTDWACTFVVAVLERARLWRVAAQSQPVPKAPKKKKRQFLASFLNAVSKSCVDGSVPMQCRLGALLGLAEDWVSQGLSPSQGFSPPEAGLWGTASAWRQCPRGRLCCARGCPSCEPSPGGRASGASRAGTAAAGRGWLLRGERRELRGSEALGLGAAGSRQRSSVVLGFFSVTVIHSQF